MSIFDFSRNTVIITSKHELLKDTVYNKGDFEITVDRLSEDELVKIRAEIIEEGVEVNSTNVRDIQREIFRQSIKSWKYINDSRTNEPLPFNKESIEDLCAMHMPLVRAISDLTTNGRGLIIEEELKNSGGSGSGN